jgi:vacuolar-type H+-ATPase subunit E/Vma4
MDNSDDILKKIKNNTNEENKKLLNELTQNMSPLQNESLRKILSDKEQLQKILNSPQVKQILSKFGENENGHK